MISVVFLLAFIVIHSKQRRVYEPRAVVESLPDDLRTETAPKGPFSWLTYLLAKPRTFTFNMLVPMDIFSLDFYLNFSVYVS